MAGIFTYVYGSWEPVQMEKLSGIFRALGEGFFRGMEGKKIADIGAGPGYLGKFLEEKGISLDIIALDPDRSAIRANRNAVIGRAEEMPFREGSFDAAFIIDAMHLFKEADFSFLKKGGIIVAATFYNDDNYPEKKRLLMESLGNFYVAREFALWGREKELVLIAVKR